MVPISYEDNLWLAIKVPELRQNNARRTRTMKIIPLISDNLYLIYFLLSSVSGCTIDDVVRWCKVKIAMQTLCGNLWHYKQCIEHYWNWCFWQSYCKNKWLASFMVNVLENCFKFCKSVQQESKYEVGIEQTYDQHIANFITHANSEIYYNRVAFNRVIQTIKRVSLLRLWLLFCFTLHWMTFLLWIIKNW